ncbi:MAG: hypothetical protein BHW44_11900 [Roseburia sp. 40_7]|nr:MAG: hypothetical protein BHW44_11900 [Roseburia sp. 40_7]
MRQYLLENTAKINAERAGRQKAEKELRELQDHIKECNEGIENGKNELLELLNHKAAIQARGQKFDTMIEQVNIRKAQLNQRLLQRKSEESNLDVLLEEQKQALNEIVDAITQLKEEQDKLTAQQQSWKEKLAEVNRNLDEDTTKYHKAASRLESLRNIAEKYDGYGNSVVSDLIKVEKKYETAIETALGGSIQNIVTEDEQTAKRMITYLKQNRLGRATFLPLTSVDGKGGIRTPEALKEKGVIGLANTLVQHEEKYRGVISYLLGRVVVTDTIDNAIALAKKYHHSLSIVTLEGESLRPGGSMTGGAFRNSSNLLGRNREIENLTVEVDHLKQALIRHRERREEILTAQALLNDDMETVKEKLQQQYLLENTAKINAERAGRQKTGTCRN